MAYTKMAKPSSEDPLYTNQLITEKSPYLLQHAHNPVKWYPWCQEAIDKARQEKKLIFLSIGYSTCHWCHVMEKESFENEDVAKVMNEHFINIKVDREERPDIDRVYMLYLMYTTGSGGWPMSIFLSPDLRAVTGGTYYPPEESWGKPAFKTTLLSVAKKWTSNSAQCLATSASTFDELKKITLVIPDKSASVPGEATWDQCVRRYISSYEPEFGGFGTAPKFPQVSIFNFLFHYYARDKSHPEGRKCFLMCLYTLTKIAKGGIHDHVSSGFARYSVDNDWHVPHFEKMLYDQAQLTFAYTDAFLTTRDQFYADVVRDIITYVNRDLRHKSGGYYSAEDSDSYPTFGAPHKKEGAFYVWEYKELKTLLRGKKMKSIPFLQIFCDYFNVLEEGNVSPSDAHSELTNKNVLIIYGSKEETAEKFGITLDQFNEVLSKCISILHTARQKRPRPHLDSKILCSWNGLMMAGLAQAGQGLGEKDFIEDALKTAQFIYKYLYDSSTKTLLHCCYIGDKESIGQIEKPIKGFLDDYAFLIKGLLDLYEASSDSTYLGWAKELQENQNELFWDTENGGYYTSSADDSTVALRLKEDQDGAEPSGNSVSCHNLLRLAAYSDKSVKSECGDQARRQDMAEKILKAFAKQLDEYPTSLPELMSALMIYNDSPIQEGGGLEPARVVRSRLLPSRVIAAADPTKESTAAAGTSDKQQSRIRPSSDVPGDSIKRRIKKQLDENSAASTVDK